MCNSLPLMLIIQHYYCYYYYTIVIAWFVLHLPLVVRKFNGEVQEACAHHLTRVLSRIYEPTRRL